MSKAQYALVFLVVSLVLLLLVLNSIDTERNTPEVVIHESSMTPPDEMDLKKILLLAGPGLSDAAENEQTAVERVFNCIESTISELSDEERQQRHARRFEILAVSEDAEHVLVAGLLGPVWGEFFHMPTLERALELAPDSVLVNWSLLQACTRNSDRPICKDIENRAMGVDGTNGAVWAEIAIRRAGTGDLREVVDALRRANAAPLIDYYYLEQIQIFERAFAVDTDSSYAVRIQEAMLSAFYTNNGAFFLYGMCKDKAQQFELLREQCLQIGRRLEHESDTAMDTLAAYGIQREMLRVSGSSRDLAEVEEKIKRSQQEERILLDRIGNTVFNNDQLTDQFIEQWSAHGQMAAFGFLSTEIERLKSVPGYDPCPKEAISER